MTEPAPLDRGACSCPWAWRQDLGRLYGISMGSGWIRVRDADDCPDHAHGRSHSALEQGAREA